MNAPLRTAAGLMALGILLTACQKGESPVERGRYLVEAMGCADCHTPQRMGERGPEPDPTLHFAGHPESVVLPPAPAGSGPWLVGAVASNTAWAGPWGVSYCSNLTPDPETGLGAWTESEFRAAMRSGRQRGQGRTILPPMPTTAIGRLSDEDLDAVFAYLRSLPPIRNRVPAPIPPAVGN